MTFEVGVAEMHCVCGFILTSFRVAKSLEYRPDYKVLTFQVGQVHPFFIVRQMRPDALRHYHDERPIIHIQPITAPNKLIVRIACERAIGLTAEVGLIKARHVSPSWGRLPWFDPTPFSYKPRRDYWLAPQTLPIEPA